MTVEYPDILGEFFDARQRFETDGVQYVARLDTAALSPGQVATLSLGVQNTLDVPIDLLIHLELPKKPKNAAGFAAAQSQMTLSLSPAEVGELRIPIQATEVPNGGYAIQVQLRGKLSQRGRRLRNATSPGSLPPTPLKDTVGLELASTIGVGYTTKKESRSVLGVRVEGAPSPMAMDLDPQYEPIWKTEDFQLLVQAAREFNDRRQYVIKPLSREVLFTAMFNESRQRLSACKVDLSVSETIFLAKMLTHTIEECLSSEALQNGLCIPIFERLLASGVPFDNPVWLLMKIGYERIVNLSIAWSFGMLEDHQRTRVWPLEEQRAVRRFVVGQLANQRPLPVDLIYAPLILGGVLVADKVVIGDESVQASLDSLREARDGRLPELAQEDDQIIRMLDDLLNGKRPT